MLLTKNAKKNATARSVCASIDLERLCSHSENVHDAPQAVLGPDVSKGVVPRFILVCAYRNPALNTPGIRHTVYHDTHPHLLAMFLVAAMRLSKTIQLRHTLLRKNAAPGKRHPSTSGIAISRSRGRLDRS